MQFFKSLKLLDFKDASRDGINFVLTSMLSAHPMFDEIKLVFRRLQPVLIAIIRQWIGTFYPSPPHFHSGEHLAKECDSCLWCYDRGKVKSVLSKHGECQLKGASQGAGVMERDPDQSGSHHECLNITICSHEVSLGVSETT